MSGYIGNIPTPQATQSRQSFTATASQTTFATVGYTAGFIDVYLNGVHLLDGTDYTATNGSDIVLTTGAALDDVVEFVAYSTYEVNSQNYTGGLTVDNDGATVLTVDRATSDGTIIDVQKNGVSVGSIGTEASRFKIASKSVALYLENQAGKKLVWGDVSGTDYLYPLDDNSDNLGYPTQRFKDLYLSGGVYLGGTGAANKLDDYEEGTWTPTTNYGSFQLSNCRYTKVGNMVRCTLEVQAGASGAGGYLSGLPFTASLTTGFTPYFSNMDIPTGHLGLAFAIGGSSTSFYLRSYGDNVTFLAVGFPVNGAIHVDFTYPTNA